MRGRIPASVLNGRVPLLTPDRLVTYKISAPIRSHWRPATCAEYECKAFREGFMMLIDTGTELGKRQHYYLTHDTSRSCRVEEAGAGLYKFIYGPGNTCFNSAEHRIRIGRPSNYLVLKGSAQQPVGLIRRHTSPEDWAEDCAERTNRIAKAVNRN